MSEGKHTPGKLEVDPENMFLFGRCVGGVRMKDDSFMLAEIRGWGHLQYREDGADMQKANIHRLAGCWNSHDQIVELLQKARRILENVQRANPDGFNNGVYDDPGDDCQDQAEAEIVLPEIRRVLKAAGEELGHE